jgi:hypothetical protein
MLTQVPEAGAPFQISWEDRLCAVSPLREQGEVIGTIGRRSHLELIHLDYDSSEHLTETLSRKIDQFLSWSPQTPLRPSTFTFSI